MADPDDRWLEVERREIDGARERIGPDAVTVEAPLELRINGIAVAVVMRTPGDDVDLATGFCVTEGIVDGPDALASVRHCTTVTDPRAEDNVMQIVLRERVVFDAARITRNFFATSSCGVCGKASIEAAMAVVPEHKRVGASPFGPGQILQWPDRLRGGQPGFSRTGGVHAAGLFDVDGSAIIREDIGRHNAVDKVLGARMRAGGDASRSGLMVSGRVSFEIVAKALRCSVPVIAAVSAPSSLAVELAREAGMGLIGFVRRGRMCVYAEAAGFS